MKVGRVTIDAAKVVMGDAIRECAVFGSSAHVRRAVPVVGRHGLCVEAISIVPASKGGSVKARLEAQDVQDALREKLKVNLKLAPEVIHFDETYKYLLLGGQPYWRQDVALKSLKCEKSVVCAPVANAAQAATIAKVARGRKKEFLVLYNELRYASATRVARALVAGQDPQVDLGPRESLRFTLDLRAPLFATGGVPSMLERLVYNWFHRDEEGGGALGLGGVNAFDTIAFLTSGPGGAGALNPARVRANMEASGHEWTVQGLPVETGDRCSIECEYDNGARADINLDWSQDTDTSDVDGIATRVPQPWSSRLVVAGDRTSVAVDLVNGEVRIGGEGTGADGDGDVLLAGVMTEDDVAGEAHAVLSSALLEAQDMVTAGGADASPGGLLGHGVLYDLSIDFDGAMPSFRAVDACRASWAQSKGAEWVDV